MFDDKYIRDYAKRFGYTIRKAGGVVKLTDAVGNIKDCTDMQGALATMSVYQSEPLTSPVYEIGMVESKTRLRIAAKDSAAAKRLYRSRVRLSDQDATLTAKLVKKAEVGE